jgi:hypothetical protein
MDQVLLMTFHGTKANLTRQTNRLTYLKSTVKRLAGSYNFLQNQIITENNHDKVIDDLGFYLCSKEISLVTLKQIQRMAAIRWHMWTGHHAFSRARSPRGLRAPVHR